MANLPLSNAASRSRRRPVLLASLALVLAVSAVMGSVVQRHGLASSPQYQIDTTDFPNPERGFSQQGGDAAAVRGKNFSLQHVYFRLDDFKNQPISQAYLSGVAAQFDAARAAGIKVVPRFTYNFPSTYPINPSTDADAPVAQVLGHLDQLAPVLKANADVTAYMEAGFVGAWGEWHSSTNNLTSTANETSILNKILGIMPPERMVVLRYQRDKKAIFSRTTPLASGEAFSGTAIARVGHLNDCFVSSPDDTGTYDANGTPTLQQQKDYLGAENLYVPQGGETCASGSAAQPYIQCPATVADMAAQHWSQLNSEYEPGVIATWKQQGCYDTIAKNLGYRLRLVSSSLPDALRPGGTFTAAFTVTNDGYAAPYNPRGLELVLRNTATNQEYVVKPNSDPRRWTPGTQQTVQVTAGLPSAMAPGTYAAYLNLPDPQAKLYGRPEYSIRLANVGVWEAATGYNRLLASVAVSTTAAGTPYAGSTYFTVKAAGSAPTATPAATPGDLNNDGTVGPADLSVMLSHWGSAFATADLNGDGRVGPGDLSILLGHWSL